MFFSTQIEIELRDWSHIERRTNILVCLDIDSAKDYLCILICCCSIFKNRFEAHARLAAWWPKIDDDRRLFFYYQLQMSKWADCENFSKFWLCKAWLLMSSSHSCELLHKLSHLVHIRLATSTHSWHTSHTWHTLRRSSLLMLLTWRSYMKRFNLSIFSK